MGPSNTGQGRAPTIRGGSTIVRPLASGPLRRVVAVLCVTEIISWGVLFYAFPVLLAAISDTQGWPLTVLVGIFTAAQLVSAAAGVWVGHHLDRYGPRALMAGGSALAVASIVAVAMAPNLVCFGAAWLIAGLAMAATFYPPAFTTITHWAGPDRVKALTAVTLVAGFASTVFAPLTALLVDHLSWRDTYLVLAAALVVTIPAHWWGLDHPWVLTDDPGIGPGAPHTHTHTVPAQDTLHAAQRRRFVLLVTGFMAAGLCIYAVVVNLVPLLTENALSTGEAAVALGVGGVGQVAGRLLYGPVLMRLRVKTRTVMTLGAASAATLAVALCTGSTATACIAAFAAGTTRGIFTLIQATAITDRWGTNHYGRRTSILSGGVTTATAAAPWAGSLLAAATGSYTTAFLVLGSLGALATASATISEA